MFAPLALALLQSSAPPERHDGTIRISRDRTTRSGRVIGVRAQRGNAMGNGNVRRNGRPFGSIGMPAASVIVDGERLAGAAIIMENRVFVQMRPVFERLGVTTTYRAGDPKIEAFSQDRGISLTIGDNYAMLPERTRLDAPPIRRDGQVFIPLRAVSQAFRADVMWMPSTRTAVITSSAKTRRNGQTPGSDGLGSKAGATGGGTGSTGG